MATSIKLLVSLLVIMQLHDGGAKINSLGMISTLLQQRHGKLTSFFVNAVNFYSNLVPWQQQLLSAAGAIAWGCNANRQM
mmetsp:Transcript_31299/g.63619  ORF Transcript_31299/g.63619 Transcript_31299/m.63619 type:complete len:80 (+) Transcript_31299:1775-2014(+)